MSKISNKGVLSIITAEHTILAVFHVNVTTVCLKLLFLFIFFFIPSECSDL